MSVKCFLDKFHVPLSLPNKSLFLREREMTPAGFLQLLLEKKYTALNHEPIFDVIP